METDGVGTYIPQLGEYCNSIGIQTKILSAHPLLFSSKSKKELTTENLEELSKQPFIKQQDQKALSHFNNYINNGGQVIRKIISYELIKNIIDGGNPCIVLMTSNFLNRPYLPFNFHIVVVVGYDDKNIIIHDPALSKGKYLSHPKEEFIFGIHASTYGDIDNGSVLSIS